MAKYFIGNAILENKDEGPAVVSFDGETYELFGFCDSFDSLAEVIEANNIKFANFPIEIEVKKYKPAYITPLNKEESWKLRTAIKFERRASKTKAERNLEERL